MRFNGLDLNLLVVLDVLLTEQNITRTGERLHLSQPATSAALSRLRNYFDDDLLAQVGRKMVRTPMGDTLAKPVHDLLIQMRGILENRTHFQPELSDRTFNIMVSDYVGEILIPDVSNKLSSIAPRSNMALFPLSNDAPLEIERANIDLLIIPSAFIVRDQPSELLFEEDYVCVLCKNHPLSVLTIDDYQRLGHVLVRWGSQHVNLNVDDLFFRGIGVDRKPEIITYSFNSVGPFIAGSLRVATVHRRLAERWVKYLPLKIVSAPWTPTLSISMQWNKHQQYDLGLTWLRALISESAKKL